MRSNRKGFIGQTVLACWRYAWVIALHDNVKNFVFFVEFQISLALIFFSFAFCSLLALFLTGLINVGFYSVILANDFGFKV